MRTLLLAISLFLIGCGSEPPASTVSDEIKVVYMGKPCKLASDCYPDFACMAQWGSQWAYCSAYCSYSRPSYVCPPTWTCIATVPSPNAPDPAPPGGGPIPDSGYIWICGK